MSDISEEVDSSANSIAIVGMAGRFPQARDIEAFWNNIAQGRECISRFTPEELSQAGVPEALRGSPDFVPARATLEDPFHFDASFFGMTPAEAAMVDPQQRLFLECSWEALEHAGYEPFGYPDLVGVYAGLDINTYALGNLLTGPQDMASILGSDKDYMATRVCFKLNLRGPGVTVQTACSTSLVAVQMACQSLLGYQCDMALAGGVGIAFPQKAGYLYQKGGILSPDGHCRSFDAQARGTVGGDGLGVVVLKRLQDALEAGDTVHAIIRGAAINNDGAQKMGFTAPSVKGQAEVISMALAMADVHPESIGYVEAHGTATEMGDPVEIAALTEAWRAYTDKTGFCALGSVKSNLGHMNSAAGVGGLLKAVLALKHRMLPPSLHFESPNPMIDLAHSPFVVNTRLRPWEASAASPRRATVSSFAVGGTNAHVILEEAPPAPPSGPSRPRQLLVLSARSESALHTATENLVRHLQTHPEQPLADVAHTLLAGRQLFTHRRMVVCRTAEEARAALPHAPILHREPRRAPVVFLFPGQGAQHVQMARELYEQEPSFREELEECARLLEPALGMDLRRVLYPEPGHEAEAARLLTETRLAQPALFVVEYALARLWMSWGVQPEAMLGHSVGEYVAACLSGVMTREDALRLVALRGTLMQRLPPGAMLAVSLPEEEAARFASVSVAALNAPGMTVLSGTNEAIETIEQTLRARGVACTRLHTSHAFHSTMMEPAVEQLRAAVARVTLSPPRLPYLSNVTGTWISAAEAQDPGYWARHLRAPVRFSQAVSELLTDPERLLLEVGPGRTLLSLVGRHGAAAAAHLQCASLGHVREQTSDFASLLEALGRVVLADVPVDWAAFQRGQQRRRIPLPTYPFERQRYFREPARALLAPASPEGSAHKRPTVREWLYGPSWKRVLAPPALQVSPGHWVLFSDGSPLAIALADQLATQGARLTTVLPGASFRPVAPDRYELAHSASEDYPRLLEALAATEAGPLRILHTWSLPDLGRNLEATLSVGFFSVLHLARALARRPTPVPVQLTVLTSGVAGVLEEDAPCPEKATLLGLGQVISQEMPHVRARTFDVLPSEVESPRARCVEQLLAGLGTASTEPLVAWRGGHPWLPTFEPLPAPAAEAAPPLLRERGVYLIIGGLGGLGMTLAEHLARAVRARLVLTSRSGLLPREEWDAWLGSHDERDAMSQKLLKIRELEALGAEVLALSADVSDEPRMAGVVERALERFNGLHGVIHAAGLTGMQALRAIADTTSEHCEKLFRPKLQGLRVLERVLPQQLDFCLLCASLASALGGVGFAAYAAASHFMDAWAREQGQQRRGRWLSVDWDAWQTPAGPLPSDLLGQLALRPDEGAEALRAILSSTGPEQILVSTQELEARRERVRKARTGSPLPAQEGTAPANRHERRSLDIPYVAPRTALEQSVAELWQGLFGISQVGVNDHFFKLGGDSLSAIQLATRLRDTMGVDLPLNELFTEPTVAGLAARIERFQKENQARQGAVETTLSMVENLSDEEVERMLREMKR